MAASISERLRRVFLAAAGIVALIVPTLAIKPAERPASVSAPRAPRSTEAHRPPTMHDQHSKFSVFLSPSPVSTSPELYPQSSEPDRNAQFPLEVPTNRTVRAQVPKNLIGHFREAAAEVEGLPWTMLASISAVETNFGRAREEAMRLGLTPIVGYRPGALFGADAPPLASDGSLAVVPTPRQEIRALARRIERVIDDPAQRSNPYAMARVGLSPHPDAFAQRLIDAQTRITGLEFDGSGFVLPQSETTPSVSGVGPELPSR